MQNKPTEINTIEELYEMIGGAVECRNLAFLAAFCNMVKESYYCCKSTVNDAEFCVYVRDNKTPNEVRISLVADTKKYWDWFDIPVVEQAEW